MNHQYILGIDVAKATLDIALMLRTENSEARLCRTRRKVLQCLPPGWVNMAREQCTPAWRQLEFIENPP
jgi:hypothetical protein